MISQAAKISCLMSDKQISAHFMYYQIKTHDQTSWESHDLNIDFLSFEKGFKQLCVTNFLQECTLVSYLRLETSVVAS